MAITIRLKHENTEPKGTVEVLDIEEYLLGVLNAEMGTAGTPIEALKAQAIAARSYVLFHRNTKSGYDVTDTTKYQAYKPGEYSKDIKDAVSSTAGKVLTYRSVVIEAVYSSSNGGRTYSSEEVWGSPRDYLIRKQDRWGQRATGTVKSGHGVGMCQRGAILTAKEDGTSHTDILAFYYPGTVLKSDYAGLSKESSGGSKEPKITGVDNKGSRVVNKAKELIGTIYKIGGTDPSVGLDTASFVQYVYREAIDFTWEENSDTVIPVASMITKKPGRLVTGTLMLGDLLYYKLPGVNTINHVGIYAGMHQIIHMRSPHPAAIQSIDDSYYQQYYVEARRMVEDVETSIYESSSDAQVPGSTSATMIQDIVAGIYSRAGIYLDTANERISSIESQEATSLKYGYLIDLTNGGEFKFVVPEFEDSVKANWDTNTVLGRSSEVVGYNSTSSKSITVTLDIAAGVAPYDKGVDPVGDMAKDINFLQSLVYPDYSKAIVFPPPTVLLYLNPERKIKGIVEDVTISNKKPYDLENRPMVANISFTVTQVTDYPPDYTDIRNTTVYSY